ncbi:MAG: hypothetical protein ACFFE8_13980 [Candidatus Heimdallarchaeota archaeon]
MSRRPLRDPRKLIHHWMRREVQEKGAQLGELRRIKKKVLVKKGLPQIPSLVIQTDQGLPFVVVLFWKPVTTLREIRLYYFDENGHYQLAETFSDHHNLEALRQNIESKTKLITRYPAQKKELTIIEKTSQLNNRFQRIWTSIAKKLHVPKKQTRNRPLIRLGFREFGGPFQTASDGRFIYFQEKNPHIPEILYYYAFLYMLPKNVRSTPEVGIPFALSMLRTIKVASSNKIQFSSKEFMQQKIYQVLLKHSRARLQGFYRNLLILAGYHTEEWHEHEFLDAFEFFITHTVAPDKQILPAEEITRLFYMLYEKNSRRSFLYQAFIIGLLYNVPITQNLLDPSLKPDRILLALDLGELNQALDIIYDGESVFSNQDRPRLLKYIKNRLDNLISVEKSSSSIILLKNTTDVKILVHTITFEKEGRSKDLTLVHGSIIFAPYAQVEVPLVDSIPPKSIVGIHFHLDFDQNHRTIRNTHGCIKFETAERNNPKSRLS